MKKTIAVLLLLCLCAALCSCSVNLFSYDHADRYTAGAATVTGRVESVDVNWVDGSVTIGTHDGEGVILRETSGRSLKGDDELRWWLDGTTLRVQYAASGIQLGVNLNKQLTVLLPAGTALSTLEVDVVSADVSAEGIAADKVVLNTVSGDAELTLDTAYDVKANAVSGNVTLRFARLPQELKADTVSGDVTIVMPADANATIEFDTVSGSLDGSVSLQKDGNRYTVGSGRSLIRVNTVSGDVQLDAAK